MSRIASVVILLVSATCATAGDRKYEAKDLDKSLSNVAWLLGNWKGNGKFMDTAYTEVQRWWPVLGGKVLEERSTARDDKGNIVHEDRILVWSTGEDTHGTFYETGSGPTRFDVTADKDSIKFIRTTEKTPILTFKRKGDDEFEYVYMAMAPDHGELKAVGSTKRTDDDYPDLKPEKLVDAMKPLAPSLGDWTGEAGDGKRKLLVEYRRTSILHGELVQHETTFRENGKITRRQRIFSWYDATDKEFKADYYSSDEGCVGVACTVRNGTLDMTYQQGKDGDGKSWRFDGTEWSMGETNAGGKFALKGLLSKKEKK